MKRVLIAYLIFLMCATGRQACADGTPAETPQALYLQAGKMERQGNVVRARELYESLVDRYPTSDLAVKANDRLLELLKPTSATADEEKKPIKLEAPLPDDPVRRRGVELARLYRKAAKLRDDEINSRTYAFTTRYAHKYSRSDLASKQKEWEAGADARVRRELGISLEEIQRELTEICRQLGITGSCEEGSF
jgi:hypothetical protein